MDTSAQTDLIAFKFNLEKYAGCRPSTRPSLTGQSPMHDIARQGDILGAEIMLENGAVIDLPDHEGRRPLHEAVFFNKQDMAEFLIRNGAMMEAQLFVFGHTALYLAVQQRHRDMARRLLRMGAHLSAYDRMTGAGLLHLAARNNDMAMAGLLIAAGVDVFHEDKKGRTARDIAATAGYGELESILLKVMAHHARRA